MIRLRFVQRLTSAVVGASVAAIGAVAIATLSGYKIDLELLWIIGLGVVGVWLLLTAAIAAVKPSRKEAPVTSEDDADEAPKAAGSIPAEPTDVKLARKRAESAAKEDPSAVKES